MTPEAHKWRDHFAKCENEQLRHFPLRELETSLERAQYKVALEYLAEELKPQNQYLSQIFVFQADYVTRCAFYNFFGSDMRRPFCLLRSEGENIFKRNSTQIGDLAAALCWHYFKPYSVGQFDWNEPHPDTFIEEYPADQLFIRTKGIIHSPLSAHGWTDYWYWNDVKLTHLPDWDWSWIS